jgi:lipopolysaccharide transport system ATP-binding protein
MYVRLAFAVAAHLEPEILIVDEVLAVGDAQFQKKCLGKMEDVSRNGGRTVLFVSHNMGVISQLCEKSIYLKLGEVMSYGSTSKVMNDYLGNRTENNIYSFEGSGKSSMFVKSAKTVNEDRAHCTEFSFNQSVGLHIEGILNEFDNTAKISVTIQNTNGDYLTTIVENVSHFLEKGTASFSKTIYFEPNLISPNSYSFRIAFFNTKGHVYDLVEMICPFQIIDNGTNLALFEGINYGCFNIKYSISSDF